jgi:hypothetical protein
MGFEVTGVKDPRRPSEPGPFIGEARGPHHLLPPPLAASGRDYNRDDAKNKAEDRQGVE